MTRRKNGWSVISLLVGIFMIGITLLTIAAPPKLSFHILEVNALYIMLGFLASGLLFFISGKTRIMFTSFACCALLCLTLSERSEYALRQAEAGDGFKIRIAHYDLNILELSVDSMRSTIDHIDADVISVLGIGSPYFTPIHQELIREKYPFFQYSNDTKMPPGLVLYSKTPFSYVKNISNQDGSYIVGKIKPALEGIKEINFISLYFSPATNQEAYRDIQQQIQDLSFRSNTINSPLITFGKYNLKPWSRTMQNFKASSGLRNSRRDIRPTKPHGYYPILDPRTDHIFYSDHFKCISFETISCGSAPHFGIYGIFELKNAQSEEENTGSNPEL